MRQQKEKMIEDAKREEQKEKKKQLGVHTRKVRQDLAYKSDILKAQK